MTSQPAGLFHLLTRIPQPPLTQENLCNNRCNCLQLGLEWEGGREGGGGGGGGREREREREREKGGRREGEGGREGKERGKGTPTIASATYGSILIVTD